MRLHPVGISRTSSLTASTVGLIAAVSAWPTAAQAQVTTGELEVRLTITESCDISGSTGGSLGNALLDFGTATLLQRAIDADTGTGTQALEVLCNPGVDYTLTFDAGQNGGGNIANRAMQRDGGQELVRYQIYQDQGRNTVLNTITGEGTGTAQTVVVYGRVPAQDAPVAGSYRDVVTITMSF